MSFECDANASPPFYYYRYAARNINPPTDIAKRRNDLPWAVYAINQTNSPANLRSIPSFLTTSEQPWTIDNFTVEFDNNLICCQGCGTRNHQNVSALLSTTCYQMNVQCKPQWLAIAYSGSPHPSFFQRIFLKLFPLICMIWSS